MSAMFPYVPFLIICIIWTLPNHIILFHPLFWNKLFSKKVFGTFWSFDADRFQNEISEIIIPINENKKEKSTGKN